MQKFLLGTALIATMGASAVAIAHSAAPTAAGAPAPSAHGHLGEAMHSRAAVTAMVREHFTRLDTNRDLFLTKAEAEAGRSAMMAMHRKTPMKDDKAMFDQFDSNRDNMISRDEFARGHQQHHAMRGSHKPGMSHGGGMMHVMRLGGPMFDMADANRDSRVSLQEATAVALRHFDMADANRDGTLSREERQQMRTKMRAMKTSYRPS